MAKYLVINMEYSGDTISTRFEDNSNDDIGDAFSEIFTEQIEGYLDEQAHYLLEYEPDEFGEWEQAYEYLNGLVNSQWPRNIKSNNEKGIACLFDENKERGIIVLNNKSMYWNKTDGVKNIQSHIVDGMLTRKFTRHVLGMMADTAQD